MAKIITKRRLNPTVTLMEVSAPLIAKKALPGQFIILRVDVKQDRIPLSFADYGRDKGTITIIFQKVGLYFFINRSDDLVAGITNFGQRIQEGCAGCVTGICRKPQESF